MIRTKHVATLAVLLLLISDISAQSVYKGSRHYHLTKNRHSQITAEGSSSSDTVAYFYFILGPCLFVCSFVMVWYNERKAAINTARLQLAKQICIDVNPFVPIDPYTDGKLVFMTGDAVCRERITDPISGISVVNCTSLSRRVEVLEWYGRQPKNRAPQYSLEWSSSNTPNSLGRINDPRNWFLDSQTLYGKNILLGNYALSTYQCEKIKTTQPLRPTQEMANQILARYPGLNRVPIISGDYIYFSQSGQIDQLGCLRVKYEHSPTGPVSIIAKKSPRVNTFDDFNIAQYEAESRGKTFISDSDDSDRRCCGGLCHDVRTQLFKTQETINILVQGRNTKDELIGMELKDLNCMTHIARFGSYVCMVMGLFITFMPLSWLLGYIPLVGRFLAGTATIVIFVACILVATVLFLITLAIAWLFYHPKVGLFLALLALSGVILLIVLSTKKSGAGAPAASSSHLSYFV